MAKLKGIIFMNKEKCLLKLRKFKTKNNISLDCYEGYSYIHIDIYYNGNISAWITINEDNSIKICKLKDNFGEANEDKCIVKTIVKIAKFLNINKIYGRIPLENDYCKNLFDEFSFSIEEQFDKDYKSAKVNLAFSY